MNAHNEDMDINIDTPQLTLEERYAELSQHVTAEYLSDNRRQAVRRELGRLGFELQQREVENNR